MIDVDDDAVQQVPSGRLSYKLFGSSLSEDEKIKTHRQQLVDKLELDDDPEHMLLVSSINETISCNRELSLLYSRIERDPYLFVITFLNSAINTHLGIVASLSNSLVFSTINLIHDETVMRRAIEPALNAELNGVKTPCEILRSNSQTTRLLTLCAKALGQSLISLAVQPVIRQVLESDATFEIDPVLQPDEGARKANLKRLCDTAAALLKRVLADVPPALISICRITHAAIEAKFPNSGWIGISNIIFLRFICSSILIRASGASYTSMQKRNLVLLAKLIQAAASLKTFDSKESFMPATNKFLKEVIPQLSKFYTKFAAHEPSSNETLPMMAKPYFVVRKISSLTRIAEYLDTLSSNPTALALTNGSLTGRIAYHLGFRRIIFSTLHYCIFIYDDSKPVATGSSKPSTITSKVVQPLEQYPIEALNMPLATVNGALILEFPDPVRLQFIDDDECLKWRQHIESYMQKCTSS